MYDAKLYIYQYRAVKEIATTFTSGDAEKYWSCQCLSFKIHYL